MTLNAPRVRLGRQRSQARAKAARMPWALVATAGGGVALGALLGHFFDPQSGRRRRHTARDRAMARVRRTERRAVRRARLTEAHAVGVVRRTVNSRRGTREPLDDVTLAHKVESELFRRAHVPKGQIDINAEEGVVFLRGVVDRPEDSRRIAALAQQLTGVRGVENLLHLPGTPAPASRPKLVRERDANGGPQ
jgi:osmotically-inducible protein OsmY